MLMESWLMFLTIIVKKKRHENNNDDLFSFAESAGVDASGVSSTRLCLPTQTRGGGEKIDGI